MKALYSYNVDCGRMGELEGLFIAEQSDVKKLIGKDVYFGEVLGKHSEIYGTVDEDEIKEISTDIDLIDKLESLFEGSTISGYNPFEYTTQKDEEE